MSLFEASFNAFLYVLTLIIYWVKHKRIDLFFAVFSFFTLVSVLEVYLIFSDNSNYKLSIFNFLYLYICVILFLWPFKHAKFLSNNITVCENKLIKVLLFIFFISGCVSLVYSIPRTILLSNLDNWNEIRNNVYSGEDVEYYSSSLERFTKNVFHYLSPFGIVMAFYQITKNKINILYTISIFFVWIANSYCAATVVASRGMIFIDAVQLVLIYLIFKNQISSKRKKVLFVIASCVIVFIATYMIAVTTSRFGDDAEVDSVLYYLGHSMSTFNQDIMTPIHDYGYGKYFFKWLCPALGFNPELNLNELGCTHGTAFMTFVGCFYIDFGPFGTILIAVLTSTMLYTFTKKKKYHLSDLIIIAYFASWFLNGALVVGRSQSLIWLMVFVVYFIVRIIEKKKITLT